MVSIPYGRRLLVSIVDETARDTPDKPIVSVSRSSDLSSGWRDITFAEVARAVNQLSWWLHDTIGSSKQFETIGYLGISDVRYTIFTLAAIKAGYKSLLPSPRNQDVDTVYLMSQTKCTKFFYSQEMSQKMEAFKLILPGIDTFSIPSFEELITGVEKPYVYDKSWEDAIRDPVIVLQTSGTTGPPKAVIITNEFIATLDNHHYLSAPPGRDKFTIDSVTGRYYSMFPPFHMSGIMSRFLIPLLSDATLIIGPPTMVPNDELTMQLVRSAGVRKLFIAPSIVEQLAGRDDADECLSNVEWICTGGGPTAQAAGEKISKMTRFFNIFGQTETGFPPVLMPSNRDDWGYLEFFPGTGNHFDQIEAGLYELVVHRDPETGICPYQTPFILFPELDHYRSKDLFVSHPSRPNLWKFEGRSDDIVALSNGEKFNPIPMEVIIQGHPLLMGALVTGQGKIRSALLVELRSSTTASETVDGIWPVVEKANSVVKRAARISKSMILVTPPSKPFIRSPKGAVIRRQTISQYTEELAALYSDGDRTGDGPILEDSTSLVSINSFVKACISQVRGPDIMDSDMDLFVLGLDSLEVLDIAFKIKRGLSDECGSDNNGTQVSSKQLDRTSSMSIARMIYANPTINKFSKSLYAFLNPADATANTASNEGKNCRVESLVERHTQNWPKKTTSRQSVNTKHRTILLTGSTGSLGASLLSEFLLNTNVAKVFCLNRSKDAESRHRLNFTKRDLPQSVLDKKAVFLQADFSKENFGLSLESLNLLKADVDTIIHNAWQVDFNLSLESFESVHIRGVRSLIEFSLESPLQPRIYFTSSISVAMLWEKHHGEVPVPEAILEDTSETMPQGYAESKVVAERLFASAAGGVGAPATILRIGQIAGSTKDTDPAWKEAEMIPSLIKTSRSLGKVPGTLGPRDRVNWMPVDTLVDIIREIVLREPQQLDALEVFNLVNPHSSPWKALIPAIGQGMELEIVEYNDWVELLKQCDPEDTGGLRERPAIKLLGFFENFERGEPNNFQTERARTISRTMAGMQAVTTKLMEVWMKQWSF